VRQIGVKIAMDDFGTGYSSLSHLRQLPLDYVKIDRSFAFNLEFDPYYFSFIETIVKFCHLNNTKVCCEGVENDHQHKILQNTSVDNLQGYLFGHPVSANDFWRMLVQNLK
jgi:EAL domain-containing protein (putative c-di-GMP-specific phosphodiesterase class I)